MTEVQPLPATIRSSYPGRSEVVGYSHNDDYTVAHVWTHRGVHDRWAKQGETWVKTHSSLIGG